MWKKKYTVEIPEWVVWHLTTGHKKKRDGGGWSKKKDSIAFFFSVWVWDGRPSQNLEKPNKSTKHIANLQNSP